MAREIFIDIVLYSLTYFFKNNGEFEKEKVFEWLLKTVIGGYVNFSKVSINSQLNDNFVQKVTYLDIINDNILF